MKYIRTKDDKILEVNEDSAFEFNGSIYGYYYKGDFIGNSVILKTAGSIEELVDEYVRVHKTFNNMSMVCDKELAISSSKHPRHYDVYGSIWVDGNLVKVAKMNDKGELELL